MTLYKQWESYDYGFEDDFIYIFKIEIGKNNEKVYHIFLMNARTNTYMLHLPVSQASLDASWLQKIDVKEVYFDEKDNWYYLWKQEYDTGKAGVWDMEIGKIIHSLFFIPYNE